MSSFIMPVVISYKPKNGCFWSLEMNTTLKTAYRSFSCNSSASTNGLAYIQTKSVVPCDTCATRRSGNFKPSIWDYKYIQSLKSKYSGEIYAKRVSELKSQLGRMLDEEKDSIDRLEFINDLQRLGISYQFEDKIKQMLTKIYVQTYLKNDTTGNLYHEALRFRLLRQHGFAVSQDVFERFKNEKGEYKSSLTTDTKGLLQLYEASHMLLEGEHNLEQARDFSMVYLKKYLDYVTDPVFGPLVSSALELPLHWRAQRPHTRSFINTYERRPDANRVVLEFAKLDFNILQANYQEELKDVSRWWRRACLAEKLPFARDMPVECYFWAAGLLFEPEYRSFRIMAAKIHNMVTVIDDIYDVHGTLEELEMFTDVVQRWDIETMEQLPHYMQVCFSALNNFVNEMAHEVLKDQGFLAVPYLRKSWKDLCNSYLKEAKWYAQCHTPTVEEYIDNACISIGVLTVVTHALFLLTNPIEKEVVEYLYKYHDIIRCSGTILRLTNDLGTSKDEMKRGDVAKCIQCYMKQTSVSEGEAGDYVMFLIRETWKKMNKEEIEQVHFPRTLVRVAVNLGRMSNSMYRYGDGQETHVKSPLKYNMESLLFKPIDYC